MKGLLGFVSFFIGLCTTLSAQNGTLFFSTDATEVAASGAGGSAVAPGNFTAVFRDESIAMVTPGAGASATAIAHRATWAAIFGDEDGDGDYIEGVIGKVDGLHLRASAPNPPAISDFLVSFSDDVVGPLGALGGALARDGDIVRVNPGGTVTPFLTEIQIGQALNSVVNMNVDGFTIEETSGDIYLTMSTTMTIGGASLEDGGIVRIPGTAYTLNATGNVAAVTTGSAQIVLHEVQVSIFFFAAGLGTVGDLKDIEIDPAGGTFTGNGGLSVRNLWLTGEGATTAPVILRTANGGGVLMVNGVTMSGGPAFGLGTTGFQGGPVSILNALAWKAGVPTTKPRTLSLDSAGVLTPGTLKIDYGGGVAGANCFVFANLATASPPGGFTGRTVISTGSPFLVPGGFRELYCDDFADPLFALLASFPPLSVNAQGHASASYALPAITPGLSFVVQAIDSTNLALTTPVVVVAQ